MGNVLYTVTTQSFMWREDSLTFTMQRRRLLVLGGVGILTGVAGCSSEESSPDEGGQDDTPTSTDTATDTLTDSPTDEPTDSPTDTPVPASFEVVEYSVPETVEIGEEVTFEITVRNTGEQQGDFSAPLYVRTPDSTCEEGGDWTFTDVEPGETASGTTNSLTFDYIQRYEFRLGQSSKTAVMQTVSAKVSWGGEYRTPEGYRIRVDSPTLQETYEYEDFQGNIEEKEPENGGKWAFANVWVKNETGQTNYSPSARDFGLLYGNTQSDGTTFVADEPIRKGEPFEGGELQPGVERSGWILYEIDSGVTLEDLEMAWSEETFEGQIAARWGTQ
jgi:hypothetical protein